MGKRRAQLVAWRTTHCRLGPVVGEAEGLPTYSVTGVAVVLPAGAHHFRRVVECSRCGAPVIDRSHPVYRRRDLAAGSEVMCGACSGIPSN